MRCYGPFAIAVKIRNPHYSLTVSYYHHHHFSAASKLTWLHFPAKVQDKVKYISRIVAHNQIDIYTGENGIIIFIDPHTQYRIQTQKESDSTYLPILYHHHDHHRMHDKNKASLYPNMSSGKKSFLRCTH